MVVSDVAGSVEFLRAVFGATGEVYTTVQPRSALAMLSSQSPRPAK